MLITSHYYFSHCCYFLGIHSLLPTCLLNCTLDACCSSLCHSDVQRLILDIIHYAENVIIHTVDSCYAFTDTDVEEDYPYLHLCANHDLASAIGRAPPIFYLQHLIYVAGLRPWHIRPSSLRPMKRTRYYQTSLW